MSDPSDPRPDSDEEVIVGVPEASLDELLAGLEAAWQSPSGEDAEAAEASTPPADEDEVVSLVAETVETVTAPEPAVDQAPQAPPPAAPAPAEEVAVAAPAGEPPPVGAPEAPPESPSPDEGRERRGATRREAHEFKADLRLAVAGFPMQLVNLSRTGLLAETNQRLCPGRTVDVFLRYGGVRKVLRATVIRSTMHAVAPNPVFRAALQFEDELALQDTDL